MTDCFPDFYDGLMEAIALMKVQIFSVIQALRLLKWVTSTNDAAMMVPDDLK